MDAKEPGNMPQPIKQKSRTQGFATLPCKRKDKQTIHGSMDVRHLDTDKEYFDESKGTKCKKSREERIHRTRHGCACTTAVKTNIKNAHGGKEVKEVGRKKSDRDSEKQTVSPEPFSNVDACIGIIN